MNNNESDKVRGSEDPTYIVRILSLILTEMGKCQEGFEQRSDHS